MEDFKVESDLDGAGGQKMLAFTTPKDDGECKIQFY